MKRYIIEEHLSTATCCIGCMFEYVDECYHARPTSCTPPSRLDDKAVIFVLVKEEEIEE